MFGSNSKLAGLGLVALVALTLVGAPGPTAEAQTRCGTSVLLSPGDTLTRIAQRCGTSLAAILQANPQIRDPNVIQVGMSIRMPGSAQSAPSAGLPGRCGERVTVRPGDTLARIASRCGTSISALLQANAQIRNPNVIHIGMTIRMPSGVARDEPRRRRDQAGPGEYVVRPGDTLAEIARRLGIPLSVLIRINRDLDPRRMRPGIVILLPGNGRERPAEPPPMTVTGTITGEGVECPTMRGDNGRLYSLAGDIGRFGPGDRVEVRGFRPDISICQQGTTIQVERIRSAEDGGEPAITITGTLTREGVECPAMRGDDGRLYTLAGDIGRFGPGDRVQVRGQRAEASICQQGTTIEVEGIRSAG
jgi:LysM repeat protein